MINTSDVYAFLELMEQGNFNQAAEKLHLTQPGLSRKIMQLEQQVKTKLFIRTTRSVRPTEAGVRLAEHWKDAMQHYQAGLDAIGSPDDDLSGPLLVGLGGPPRHGLWQILSEEFVRRYPRVHPRVEVIPSQEVVRLVVNGDLDVGFCGGPAEDPSLGLMRVETSRYHALVPHRHRLSARKAIALADLRKERLILVAGNVWTTVRTPLDRILAPLGLLHNVAEEPIFPDTLFRRILDTGSISIHPVGPYQLLPAGISKVEVTDLDLSIETSFIWRRSTTSAVVRSMVNAVAAKLRALEPG